MMMMMMITMMTQKAKNAIVHISRDHLLVEKCIHSQLTAEMTQEDPDIQILLDHAKDLNCSRLKDKTTQADDTYYAILIKFERATEKKKHELAQTSKTSIISSLEETHRDVYRKFGIGFHVVRRSHQCWAGLG
ncbi:hypothetical protein DPMN_113602 [Dreissena polymorpha]|uniref:Uncharacterized protein n=1 Tax=Dreissena polymorpha TaxID=45954 RepID=A0A9D4KHT1_DREPO|nr:hypothetical protein DPMN_113602 [Dreissena polymorpha]